HVPMRWLNKLPRRHSSFDEASNSKNYAPHSRHGGQAYFPPRRAGVLRTSSFVIRNSPRPAGVLQSGSVHTINNELVFVLRHSKSRHGRFILPKTTSEISSCR